MPIRRLPDGTIEFDSVAEAIEYDRSVAQKESPEPKSAKTHNGTTWTPDLVKAFLVGTTNSAREVIARAVELGDGASSKTLAKKLGGSHYGIGRRVAKVVNDSEAFNQKLRAPVSLVGEAGNKTVAVDQAFVAAYGEKDR